MTLPMKRREERQRKLVHDRQQQLQRQNQRRPTTHAAYYEEESYAAPPPRDGFTPQPYDEESAHVRQISRENPLKSSRGYDDYHIREPHHTSTPLVINKSYSYDDPTPPSPIRPLPVRPHQEQTIPSYHPSHSFDSTSPTPESINVISPNHRHQRFPSETSRSMHDYREYYHSHPDYAQSYDQSYNHSYHQSHNQGYTDYQCPPPHTSEMGDSKLPLVSDSFDTHENTREKDPVLTEDPNAPVVPPGTASVCANMSEVNSNDVLCGRGGGTNSQVGNRRFRKLVQDYQPIYLTARRKEKPIIARNIVRMIRQRGGRFLKKDDANETLWEVGDERAEAKTSQALREGLDVRASKGVKKDSGRETPKRGHGERLAGEMFVETTKKRDMEVVLRSDEDRRWYREFDPPRAKIQRREDYEEGEERWSVTA